VNLIKRKEKNNDDNESIYKSIYNRNTMAIQRKYRRNYVNVVTTLKKIYDFVENELIEKLKLYKRK
jgi:hypothetical protein